MDRNCITCKHDVKPEFEEPCKTCINVTYLSSFGNVSTLASFGHVSTQWQPKEETPKEETPKERTYTREEVFELMREAYDEGYSHEDNMSCKTMLDNFDKLKSQKK